jgi:hypothetical protein
MLSIVLGVGPLYSGSVATVRQETKTQSEISSFRYLFLLPITDVKCSSKYPARQRETIDNLPIFLT